MSLATLNTNNEYVGNGSTNSFPITFEYTDVDTIIPTVDDIAVGYSFDNALVPTAVIFDVVPADLTDILIQRVTVKNQEVNLDSSQSFSSQAENIEAQFDRVVAMVQEVEAGTVVTSSSTTSGAAWEEWAISTDYLKNQLLRDGSSGSFYTVVADYTSNAFLIATDITSGDLELFNQGEQGEQGIQGIQGLTGAAGSNGSNGSNGAAGADGIFSSIASQPTAEAGTDNTEGMSPLRVQQNFENNIIPYRTSANQDVIDEAQDGLLSDARQRVLVLENNAGINQFSGKQNIGNGEVTDIDLEGADADVSQFGYGQPLNRNNTGTQYAKASCLIRRSTSDETRLVQVDLILYYFGSDWYVARKSTTVLNDGEPDGVVFSIATDGDGVGLVSYTSDTMAGTDYAGDIQWLGQEIPNVEI